MILAQFAEAEIDAVLASTRQYSSSGSIDDDHLPPTLHLSQGNVYPDYTPTPINDKPVFSGTALINPHFRNIATLASGIGVAMTQPPPQIVAPQSTYIPQMVDIHSYFIHSTHKCLCRNRQPLPRGVVSGRTAHSAFVVSTSIPCANSMGPAPSQTAHSLIPLRRVSELHADWRNEL